MQAFLLCLKSNDTQTFKSLQLQKNFFTSVYVITTTCFDECFFSIWYLKDIFLMKVYRYHDIFFNLHVLVFFETSVLKEVSILHYCISTTTVQNTKVPKKMYNIFAKYSKLIWFMITFFTLLFLFVTVSHFPL